MIAITFFGWIGNSVQRNVEMELEVVNVFACVYFQEVTTKSHKHANVANKLANDTASI